MVLVCNFLLKQVCLLPKCQLRNLTVSIISEFMYVYIILTHQKFMKIMKIKLISLLNLMNYKDI